VLLINQWKIIWNTDIVVSIYCESNDVAVEGVKMSHNQEVMVEVFRKVLAKMEEEECGVPEEKVEEKIPFSVGKQLEDLQSLFEMLHNFQPGDLVQWKPGLKNRDFPKYGEPAIVQEVKKKFFAVADYLDSSSPSFQEPLDLVLGVLDCYQNFLSLHFDQRRFEPYQPHTPHLNIGKKHDS
jgi:hypothetical protein